MMFLWRTLCIVSFLFFFFNDTATTEIYTLSYTTLFRSETRRIERPVASPSAPAFYRPATARRRCADRKSTRLNSSHPSISYAVFCLKKKKKKQKHNNSNKKQKKKN